MPANPPAKSGSGTPLYESAPTLVALLNSVIVVALATGDCREDREAKTEQVLQRREAAASDTPVGSSELIRYSAESRCWSHPGRHR